MGQAETARCPSAVTATAVTAFVWPDRVRSARPLLNSHTFSVLSADPEITHLPSSVIATAVTESEWPDKVRNTQPLANSHTFSVRSCDAETARGDLWRLFYSVAAPRNS